MKLINLFYFLSIYVLITLLQTVKLVKVIFRQMKLTSFPETLPSFSSSSQNITKFDEFKITMLSLNVSRYEAKEIFHMVDRNNDKLIDPDEWANFYNVFGLPFQNCDKKKIYLLSVDDLQACLTADEIFSNMVTYNKKLNKSGDDKKFIQRIFNALKLDNSEYLNFYDYIKLRNYNKIYKILLDKEGDVYYQNFPIAVHLMSQNFKYYEFNELEKVFNKTIPNAYFPSTDNMDFATFCTLANLFRLFIENNERTNGYLSSRDIMSVGQLVETYPLIKNYTTLFVRNNLIYESLKDGIKINNFYKLDDQGNKALNLKSYYMKTADYKISVEELFFIYRVFETVYSKSVDNPFQLNTTQFSQVIKDDFFQDVNDLLNNSFDDFQKVAIASNIKPDKNLFLNLTFNILDLNNNTYIEIYELMLVNEIAKIYNILQTDKKVLKTNNNTIHNQTLEDMITPSEDKYLNYINYKFNNKTLNFHQILFLLTDRLRDTSKLVTPTDIFSYLNYYGFYISEDFKSKFFTDFNIDQDGYLNYLLALQKFMEFYTNNMG